MENIPSVNNNRKCSANDRIDDTGSDMLLKIFSVYYALFYLVYTFYPSNITFNGRWEWVDMVFMVTALTGMLSYAFGFRILTRRFWDYFFYLFIIYELLYMTWLQRPLLEKLGKVGEEGLSNAVNIFLMGPLAFSVFRLQQRWNITNDSKKTKTGPKQY